MLNSFFKKSGLVALLIIRSVIIFAGIIYVGYWPIEQLVTLDEPAQRIPIPIVCGLLLIIALFIWLDNYLIRKLLKAHSAEITVFVINAFSLFISLIPFIGFFLICLFSSFGDSFIDILKFIGFYLISLLIYAEFLYFNWFRSSKRNSN